MTAPVIAFFNTKGTVESSSLVYHLAWAYADRDTRVVAADLDPQANLTGAFLDDERLEELWPAGDHPHTVYGCLHPLLRGGADLGEPHLERIDDPLALLVGDLLLASVEDELSNAWPRCAGGEARAFRVTSAFWRIMHDIASAHQAELILMDLGPSLGAINRAAFISADYVVVPLSLDIFSTQALRTLGPTLRNWREQWQNRLAAKPKMDVELPAGAARPVGYVVVQQPIRLDRPAGAYERSIARVPALYREAVLAQPNDEPLAIASDPSCLALLRTYPSLTSMAQEARKPIFHLKPADGAIGAHARAVQDARRDFEILAREIAKRVGIAVP